MRKLDTAREFGTVHGTASHRYEQDGLLFDNQGNEVQPAGLVAVWTREELSRIGNEGGINGLREIATPMGIKGRGVEELIDEILAGQG